MWKKDMSHLDWTQAMSDSVPEIRVTMTVDSIVESSAMYGIARDENDPGYPGAEQQFEKFHKSVKTFMESAPNIKFVHQGGSKSCLFGRSSRDIQFVVEDELANRDFYYKFELRMPLCLLPADWMLSDLRIDDVINKFGEIMDDCLDSSPFEFQVSYIPNGESVPISCEAARNDESASISYKAALKKVKDIISSIGVDSLCECEKTANATRSNNLNFLVEDEVLFDKKKTTLVCYSIDRKDESYTIPDGVTSIGGFTFSGSDTLASVTIPASVTQMGSHMFLCCKNLSTISVDSNNAVFTSVDGVLFTKDKSVLVKHPMGRSQTAYTIPDGVTKIGEDAFASEKLISVTIPNGVVEIAHHAFEACKNLETVNIYAEKSCISIQCFSFPKHTTINYIT